MLIIADSQLACRRYQKECISPHAFNMPWRLQKLPIIYIVWAPGQAIRQRKTTHAFSESKEDPPESLNQLPFPSRYIDILYH